MIMQVGAGIQAAENLGRPAEVKIELTHRWHMIIQCSYRIPSAMWCLHLSSLTAAPALKSPASEVSHLTLYMASSEGAEPPMREARCMSHVHC